MKSFKIQSIIDYFKRPQVWGYLLAAVVCWLLAFLFFYPEASDGGSLRQYDMLQGLANGHETQQYAQATGETPRWTNSLFSGMPTFQISPSYPSNSLFDWINSLYGMGLPNPSNLLCMMMMGFLILMASLRIKPLYGFMGAVAFGFSSYWIIIIGAGHLWKFITVSYVPPTIAGVILAYRGRYIIGGAIAAISAMMQLSANHPQMSYYFGMVIAAIVVAYLVSAIRNKALKKFGIATGSLALAAILALAANSPSLYNTYEYSKETMRGGHSELTSAQESQSLATDGLNRDYITTYSYQPDESFSLLIPNIKGGASAKIENGQAVRLSITEAEQYDGLSLPQPTQDLLLNIAPYYGDPEGTNGPVYVGAIICALFILGCLIVKGPLKWALLVMTLLSIFLAMGRHFMSLTDLFIDIVPMYSKFRTVESILVIAQFTMPLLGVLGLQKLLTAPNHGREYFKQVAWAFGVPAAICLIAIVVPSTFGPFVTSTDYSLSSQYVQKITHDAATHGIDPNSPQVQQIIALSNIENLNNGIFRTIASTREAILVADAWRSLWFILGAGAVLLIYSLGKLTLKNASMVAGAAVAVLVVADLYNVNDRYLNANSFAPEQMASENPIPASDADRAIIADANMHGYKHYRVMSFDQFSSPMPSYHHSMIGGYHAAKLTRYQDLIDAQIPIEKPNFEVLDMLNARYFMAQGQWMHNPEALGNAWFVDSLTYVKGADAEMQALTQLHPATRAVADEQFKSQLGERAVYDVTADDYITLTDYAPDQLTYEANSTNGGLAVFSEVYFPWGWQVTIDDKPATLGRVNYVLRALQVPAGKHTITMKFDPQSLHVTGTLATIAIILIYLWVIASIALSLYRRGTAVESLRNDEKTTSQID